MSKNNNKKQTFAETKKPSTQTAQQVSKPKQEKDKRAFILTRTTSVVLALAVTIWVAALGGYWLVARNSEVLFMAQMKDFFTTDYTFLVECMRQPGGLISWVASFLTQFFYRPEWGATIMVGLWVASLWLSKLAFRVRTVWMAVLAMPVICLLISTIDVGYWLYYVKQTGYWFYGTVGYLCAILLVLFNRYFRRKKADSLITATLVALTYPFVGWYSLLALLYIAACALADNLADRKTPKKEDEEIYETVIKSRGDSLVGKIFTPLYPLLLIAVMPWLFSQFYAEMRTEDAWIIGFPAFTNDTLMSLYPSVPFMVMAVLPLIFPFLPKRKEVKNGMAWLILVLTVVLMASASMWVKERNFENYNYRAEIRMYRAADEQNWDQVLDEMGSIHGDASRQMVLMKNIALMNKREMGTGMFKYNNMGEPPTNGFDTLSVHMVQTSAPLIYYYHGKTNFTVRWCIENSVEYGYDFDNLRMLARCALVGGEMDVARKYLSILSTSLFHKDWAENLMPITEKPELIKEHHEFDKVRELRDHMGTVLDGDNGLCEMYLLNYFSNTMNKDDKLLQELTLNYALVQKDIQLFWPRFFLYAQMHKGEEMPVHYQEAAYLYGHLEPQNVDISNMPFDKKVKERYQGFQQLSQSLLQTGMKPKEVGEAMKSTYGDTFYWFYFFCRDVHSY